MFSHIRGTTHRTVTYSARYQIIFFIHQWLTLSKCMPLKGCRRKSQRAEIKFVKAVRRFRIGDKITNDNIKIQLKVKTVNVMVK